MRGRRLLRGEDAGAFERDVDAEFLPRQLRGVSDRRYFDGAVAAADRVAFNRHFAGEAAVNAVVAKQVSVGLDRAKVVNGDDFNILALALDGGAQDVSADPAETVNCNAYGHPGLLRCRP